VLLPLPANPHSRPLRSLEPLSRLDGPSNQGTELLLHPSYWIPVPFTLITNNVGSGSVVAAMCSCYAAYSVDVYAPRLWATVVCNGRLRPA
jgi:hypothetical protein